VELLLELIEQVQQDAQGILNLLHQAGRDSSQAISEALRGKDSGLVTEDNSRFAQPTLWWFDRHV